MDAEGRVKLAERALAAAEREAEGERNNSIMRTMPQLRRDANGNTYIGPESQESMYVAEAKVKAAKRALAEAKLKVKDPETTKAEAAERADFEARLSAAERTLALAEADLEFQKGLVFFKTTPQIRRDANGNTYIGSESQTPLYLAEANVKAAKRALEAIMAQSQK